MALPLFYINKTEDYVLPHSLKGSTKGIVVLRTTFERIV